MNTSNNTQAQTSIEQTTPASINVNDVQLIRLIDNVDNATTTAISILKIMAGFFSECQGNLYDKDALYYTTQAAIEEIKRIEKAVNAYAESQK